MPKPLKEDSPKQPLLNTPDKISTRSQSCSKVSNSPFNEASSSQSSTTNKRRSARIQFPEPSDNRRKSLRNPANPGNNVQLDIDNESCHPISPSRLQPSSSTRSHLSRVLNESSSSQAARSKSASTSQAKKRPAPSDTSDEEMQPRILRKRIKAVPKRLEPEKFKFVVAGRGRFPRSAKSSNNDQMTSDKSDEESRTESSTMQLNTSDLSDKTDTSVLSDKLMNTVISDEGRESRGATAEQSGETDVIPDDDEVPEEEEAYVHGLERVTINGITPDEYRRRLRDSISLYKAMSIRDLGSKRRRNLPFMNRNLCFIKAYNNKEIAEYVFGETKPAEMWPGRVVQLPPRQMDFFQKKARVELLICTLKEQYLHQHEAEEAHNTRVKFSLDQLTSHRLDNTRNANTLYNNAKFRKEKKIKQYKQPNPYYYMLGSVYKSKAIIETPNPITTVVFHLVRFESTDFRLAQIHVYMVYKIDGVFYKPEKVPGGTFVVQTNTPLEGTPIGIDLPLLNNRRLLAIEQAYIFIRVEFGADGVKRGRRSKPLDGEKKMQQEDVPHFLDGSSIDPSLEMYGVSLVYDRPEDLRPEMLAVRGYIPRVREFLDVTLAKRMRHGADFRNPDFMNKLADRVSKDGRPWIIHSVALDYKGPGDDKIEMRPKRLTAAKIERMKSKAKEQREKLAREQRAKQQEVEAERTLLDVYTGGFQDGVYLGDKRNLQAAMTDTNLEDLMRIDPEMRKFYTESLSLFPKKLKYRFFSGVAAAMDRQFREKLVAGAKTTNDIKNVGEKWYETAQLETIMSTSPLKCVICERSFQTYFHLMLHYHLTYPRLAFLVSFEMPEKQNDVVTEIVPAVDVFIDPNFRDLSEIERVASDGEQAFWLVTHSQARRVRDLFHMDLTIFTEFLSDTSFVRDADLRRNRFIDHLSKQIKRPDDPYTPLHNTWPWPGAPLLIDLDRKNLYDFIDISPNCKMFMFVWNAFIHKVGPSRVLTYGRYMLYRLFIQTHRKAINEFGESFKSLLLKRIHNRTNFSDNPLQSDIRGMFMYLDLCNRVKYEDYHPLTHPAGQIVFPMQLGLKQLHKMYLNHLEKVEKGAPPKYSYWPQIAKVHVSEVLRKGFDARVKHFTMALKELESFPNNRKPDLLKPTSVIYSMLATVEELFPDGKIPELLYKVPWIPADTVYDPHLDVQSYEASRARSLTHSNPNSTGPSPTSHTPRRRAAK